MRLLVTLTWVVKSSMLEWPFIRQIDARRNSNLISVHIFLRCELFLVL
jgi:hypothetical protein